eukprot:5698882-Prymnesium_polylepis.1
MIFTFVQSVVKIDVTRDPLKRQPRPNASAHGASDGVSRDIMRRGLKHTLIQDHRSPARIHRARHAGRTIQSQTRAARVSAGRSWSHWPSP